MPTLVTDGLGCLRCQCVKTSGTDSLIRHSIIINRKLKYCPSKQHCPTFPSPPPSLPPSPSSSRSRCSCCCSSSSSSSSFPSDFGSSSSPSLMIYLSITSGISVQ